MALRQAIIPGVVAAALVAGAVVAPGCVPASERIENRPLANAGTAPGADTDGAHATPGSATPSQPIRPPTSAIAETETPADDAPQVDSAVVTPRPPEETPQAEAPVEPSEESPARPATPTPEPAPPAEPVMDTDDSPAAPDEAPAPPDNEPDDEPGDEPEDAPEEAPEDTPPAEPPLHAAWDQGSAYNALFKPDELVTLTGDIEAVGTFIPAEEAQPGLLLSVKIGDEVAAIHGAPLRYLRSIEVRFDFGERLSIEGSWATVDGKRVLLAQAITRGETRVEIRDAETGRPAWVTVPATAEPGEDAPAPPPDEDTPPA